MSKSNVYQLPTAEQRQKAATQDVISDDTAIAVLMTALEKARSKGSCVKGLSVVVWDDESFFVKSINKSKKLSLAAVIGSFFKKVTARAQA